MKKLDVSKILVLTAMTVTLMACGGTQTDQSEGLNQQDTNSLKASPRTEGGGQVAKPVKTDEGGGQAAKSQSAEAALPFEEGGGQLTEGGGQLTESEEQLKINDSQPLEEGGGQLTEGGGQFAESEEQLKINDSQPLEEGGGQFTLEGNVLVLRGTMPKGATEGLLLINGREFIKLEITKDGTFVMKVELSDEDLKQMGFQLAFKDEVKNFIIVESKIQEVIVKR